MFWEIVWEVVWEVVRKGGRAKGQPVRRRRREETRGAQQPKLMHREEVGGWRWVGR